MTKPLPRIFSGVQPTGSLHLGNYYGAIQNFVRLQDSYECLFSVVDLHAITAPYNPDHLRVQSLSTAATFIACGLDADRSIVFLQSDVSAHTELAWYFSCIARLGWLNRMTQFKEKAGKNREKQSIGLYAYPILMAADILAYRATHVPVGEDQVQHLELTRDIAQKFNSDYASRITDFGLGGDFESEGLFPSGFFPLVKPLIPEGTKRIMSLRNGTDKMSKSDPSALSRIELTDSNDEIANKIRRAKSDSIPFPLDLEELTTRPEANNLLSIFAAASDQDKTTVMAQYGGGNFSTFKDDLIEALITVISPIRSTQKTITADRGYLERVLANNSERARALANPVIANTKRILGF